MEPIFIEKEQQAFFDRNGFVKLSLLSEQQADELFSFFELKKEEHATVSDLHHTTTDTGNKDLIIDVDRKIKSIFIPALEKKLQNFKPLVATYHIKEPGAGSATGIHQDPTFVDEKAFYSVNVWVALHDIGAENGHLFFVPGSHKIVDSIRSIPSHPTYYDSFRDKLPGLAESVPLKKGEAVVFSNATVHGATDNLSPSIRLAATLLLCSEKATWHLYYNNTEKENALERYNLTMDSFIFVGRGEKPKASFEEVSSLDAFPVLTYKEFMQKTGLRKERPICKFSRFIKQKLSL